MTSIHIEQPSDLDIGVIHGVLTNSYWSPGIPRATVARACAHSLCAIARDDKGKLVGFARLVTDHATFAWLCDVIVLPGRQGRGVGRELVGAFKAHPDLQHLRRWLLATRDAHGVYTPLGFTPLSAPERMMEMRNLNPHGPAAA